MKKILALVCTCFFISFPIFSQTVLTIDEAVEKALENNRNLKQSKIDFDSKERNNRSRWNIFLPDITASAGVGRNNEILNNSPDAAWNGNVRGALDLSIGTDIPYKMTRIRQEYEAGNIDYQIARKNLEVVVREAFYELLIYKKDIEIMEKNIQAHQHRYEQVLTNYESGLVPALDVLNAKLAWNERLPVYDTAVTEYRRLVDQFKIYLGVDINEEIQLSGDVENFIPENVDFNNVPERFETPELQRLKKNLEVSESSRKELSGSSLWPELSLGWDIYPKWQDLSSDNEPDDNGKFSATLSWHLDNLIPNSKGDLKIRELQDTSSKLRLKIEEEQADSISAVENLIRKIKQQQETVKTLELTFNIARESLLLTEDSYKYGAKDILDVADAQQKLLEASITILKEKYDIFCSIIELEYKLNLDFGTLGGVQ